MTEINKGRRRFLIGSGSSLLLTLLPFPAFADSPKAVCSKVGQKILFKGKNYACTKSGGKLHWELLTPAKPPIKVHPSPSSSPSSVPSVTSSPSKVSGFIIAKISDLPEGQSKIVSAKDLHGRNVNVALFLSSGVVTAHSVICTHQGCIVAADGKTLACPCHGSVFDGKTGAVINTPAPAPLQSYKVAEVDGDIYIQSDI